MDSRRRYTNYSFQILKRENSNNNDNNELQNQNINDIVYSIIPLNIYIMWHHNILPNFLKNNIISLKKDNPEISICFFNEKMCSEFIKNNFDYRVVKAYNKLKLIKNKCDLWKYCILYLNGGIYIDIKFLNEKSNLLKLTDKEYWVKTQKYSRKYSVYDGIISVCKGNIILKKCIDNIVCNVLNDYYDDNYSSITGSLLINKFFDEKMLKNIELKYHKNTIIKNNQPILYIDKEYNKNTTYSNDNYMWESCNIYSYPILKSYYTKEFTNTINKKYYNTEQLMYSGTPTIFKISENNYLINMRWINYRYCENGSFIIENSDILLSDNSIFFVDNSLNIIKDEIFLEYDFYNNKKKVNGIEDIRFFNFDNNNYYIATMFDNERKIQSVTSSIVDIDKIYNAGTYELDEKKINPSMYNLNEIHVREKNWAIFQYKNKLHVVYKWFPLQIGNIDYTTNELSINEIKYNVPRYFDNLRGSTPGIINNDEIWFVCHKAQHNTKYIKYEHMFVVFDKNMELIKYSDLFKLGDKPVEFCTGMIIEEDFNTKKQTIILSYSLQDTQSYISKYYMEDIDNGIIWNYF